MEMPLGGVPSAWNQLKKMTTTHLLPPSRLPRASLHFRGRKYEVLWLKKNLYHTESGFES